MYISLGLLWLGFKIICGIYICPIGGLSDDQTCNELNRESVMYKFYTLSDKHKFISDFIKSTTNKMNATSDNFYDDETNCMDDQNIYKSKRQSLILDKTTSIKTQWIEAFRIGTDMYRIKFFKKIVHEYNLEKEVLSSGKFNQIWNRSKDFVSSFGRLIIKTFSKKYMAYIQCYYNAASTYYFSMEYKLADHVIDNGLKFFLSKQKELYDCKTNSKQDIRNAQMWHILLLRLKFDIIQIRTNGLTSFATTNDSNEKHELSMAEADFFKHNQPMPSSAVLLFRRYFLDKSIDSNTKNKLDDWLKKPDLWKELDDDILYKDHIFMYKSLVFFNISENFKEKCNYIFKAIKRPVLSTEDRLLNYKATKKALETVESCFDSTTAAYNTDNCSEIKNAIVNNNTEIKSFESIIISKLRSLFDLEKDNLINKLKQELTINNHTIEENVLHLIVTAVIDIDKNSDKYKTNLKNVKTAIELLDGYVKYHDKNLPVSSVGEDTEEKKTSTGSSNILPQSNDYDNYTFANTIYTTEEKVKNLFIAYKWLMELDGVSNLKSEKCKEYLDKIKKLDFKEEKFQLKKDVHYMYLKTKLESESLLFRYDWEAPKRSGGWFLSIPNTNQSEHKNIDKERVKKMIKKLIYLRDNIFKSPYINRTELFTIIFRYYYMLKLDYVAMYTSIKSAITEIVVTPEDRLRNLEAHELLTVFLIERNAFGIKMRNVLTDDQVYNTFLLDQDFH